MKHTFKALSAASLFPSAVPPSFDKEMATAHALNTARCVVNLCASFHSPTVEQENHCRETTKNKKDMSISTKAQKHNNTKAQKHKSTTTQQHNNTKAQQHNNTKAQKHNTTTPQHHNTTTPQHHNTTTPQHHNNTTTEQHNNTIHQPRSCLSTYPIPYSSIARMLF
jgi:hypothetical protein